MRGEILTVETKPPVSFLPVRIDREVHLLRVREELTISTGKSQVPARYDRADTGRPEARDDGLPLRGDRRDDGEGQQQADADDGETAHDTTSRFAYAGFASGSVEGVGGQCHPLGVVAHSLAAA